MLVTAVKGALCLAFSSVVAALGQEQIISFTSSKGSLQLAGGKISKGQILVADNEYWGVVRAAGDLALDFGRVTGTNYTLSNGKTTSSPATYTYKPVDNFSNTVYRTTGVSNFTGPAFSSPSPANTVVIAGTIGHSTIIDKLIASKAIDVSAIKGEWESFVSTIVQNPVPGCPAGLVIAGSDPRGTIFGIYDVSEQIGVSPWYFWADSPVRQNKNIFVTTKKKVQGPPTVKYRGFFLNDEQPALTNWVSKNFGDNAYTVNYGTEFYSLIFEVLLRLRANYLWPTLWGSMFEVDDPGNQPLADAYEIVLGTSHTEPLMRAQNEFGKFYKNDTSPWAYNLNNKTIDEYFRYGIQRAKPYARNSLWTMGMRGTGDTAIEGLGVDHIVEMLQVLVKNQRQLMIEGLDLKPEEISTVPQAWCLYKEVMTYLFAGLEIPEDITLLWADDNWGNVRRLPLLNETSRSGGAGIYYHFDYVGDPRDYKWINTIQLSKTAEQMHHALSRGADRIWVVNVGDMKALEIPISQWFDMAYDAKKWGVDSAADWAKAYAAREFGPTYAAEIANVMMKYGMYAARRKFELVEANTYSMINYNEADAILKQWSDLVAEAEAIYKKLDADAQPSYWQTVLHPAQAGEILHKVYIGGARNMLYSGQKRNSANDVINYVLKASDEDVKLNEEWDNLLDGKWEHFMDQTHLGYDGYWQQPMRNTLPAMSFVQTGRVSVAGHVGVGVEGSNATVQGDDKYHPNSDNNLAVPPMDPYGPSTRYFDVFFRGTKDCTWDAAPWVSWVKLSQYNGTVGPTGADTRVYISIDWASAPKAPFSTTVNINVTTPCRSWDKYAYRSPMVQVPVSVRSVPSSFTKGFVESDKHVAISGSHYQAIVPAAKSTSLNKNVTYHKFDSYGRTGSGVGLIPQNTEKLSVEEAPALEYDVYFFTNHSAANVTAFISPALNYLGDWNPLEYAVSLYPKGGSAPKPTFVRPVGPTVGTGMPDGWGYAVADAVWGHTGNYTTSTFKVPEPGAYTLRFWALMPGIVVQKIVIDLGGVRPSFLGPPESFLVGRDTVGKYDQLSFLDEADTLGGSRGGVAPPEEGKGKGKGKGKKARRHRAASRTRTDDGTLFLGDGSLAAAPTPKLNQRGLRSVIKVVDDRCLVFDPPEDNPVQKFSRSVVPMGKKVKDQVFAFDRVFDDNATQADIYEGTTKNLIDSVLDGYNATVFAYGATGCGKTHTITGTAQQPGIIFLTMQELFEKIQERSDEKHTEISLSYLEIYNETIRDLLVPGGSKQGLMLREDSNQAVSVAGLTSHHPKDVQEVMDMIVQGNEYRTVSPTAANAVSSRSHAVLQINVAQKDRNADINEPHTMATLSIIDLAGSERASATKNRGERLLEGANINKSLLALGSCINALCDPRKKNHVPYRNSKLTRLLKFSLGGNCKTVMIVCVSPSSEHFDETQNTLRYANRAKNIQTKVTRNVFNVNRHVKDFLVKIDEQMALINELKAQQKDAEKIFFAKFRKQMDKRDGTVREGITRLRAAYENSAAERQDKVLHMKKMRAIERRIGLLSAWIAAFDSVCDSRGEEQPMSPSLAAMRKTAQGILIELESSRHHIRQRIDRSNWERGLDSALQHSTAQLSADDAAERDMLAREAESLKNNFMRDAYREVLEQDKAGDAAVMQVLLTAQFDILSSLHETLHMDETEAVAHAKSIINRLLDTGHSAASHVVKPDGSMMLVELFPPTKRGTPKRKKSLSVQAKSIPPPSFVAISASQQQAILSPIKASPRRRKIGVARKGVSFTPVKKKHSGTLADFDKTPERFDTSPLEPPAAEPTEGADPVQPPVPSYLNHTGSPHVSSLHISGKPNRFQAGFLSKSRPSDMGEANGSPVAPTLTLNLSSSSPDNNSNKEDKPSPLRSIPVSRAGNTLSPPRYINTSPKNSSMLSTLDENTPPMTRSQRARSPLASVAPVSASNSDNDSPSTFDALKLRSALHSVKRKERLSSMGAGGVSSARRNVSIGGGATLNSLHHRASASYSGPLASSTNGISRHRRGSSERRRSPPISCSPESSFLNMAGPTRSLTPGQARRMNMGGSLRLEGGSPQRERIDGKARRITIGGGSAGFSSAGGHGGNVDGAGRINRASRPSVIWR
ncbi:kinesin-like protein 6 [Rhypophila sp. PSN 637]